MSPKLFTRLSRYIIYQGVLAGGSPTQKASRQGTPTGWSRYDSYSRAPLDALGLGFDRSESCAQIHFVSLFFRRGLVWSLKADQNQVKQTTGTVKLPERVNRAPALDADLADRQLRGQCLGRHVPTAQRACFWGLWRAVGRSFGVPAAWSPDHGPINSLSCFWF